MSREPDALQRIGAGVAAPDAEAGRSALEALAAVGITESTHGRLATLAGWWAGVASPAHGPNRPTRLLLATAKPEPPEIRPDAGTGAVTLLLPDDVDAAIEEAAAAVDSAVDAGTDLILLSAPDRMAGRVLAAHLIDIDAVEATGWPDQARLDNSAWASEVASLRDGLRRVGGLRGVPVRLLHALGSPVIAAGSTALLQASARRTPVILDGPSSAACALLAHRVTTTARAWWQAGSDADEPLATRVLSSLRLSPLLQLDLQIEDGTAARLGLEVLRTATALLDLADVPEPATEPDVPEPATEPAGD